MFMFFPFSLVFFIAFSLSNCLPHYTFMCMSVDIRVETHVLRLRQNSGLTQHIDYTKNHTYLPGIHERKRHIVQFKYGYPQKVTNNIWVF